MTNIPAQPGIIPAELQHIPAEQHHNEIGFLNFGMHGMRTDSKGQSLNILLATVSYCGIFGT